MTVDHFNTFKEIFEKILNKIEPIANEDFFNERWGSDFENGSWNTKKIKLLNIKKTFEAIQNDQNYEKLKEIFLETDPIKNVKFEVDIFKEFIGTYLYKTNNLKFDEDVLQKTFNVLNKRIIQNYFEKMFFYTPLYNFDSTSEFSIDENFIVKKISEDEFDRITDLNFSDACTDKPVIYYQQGKLRFLLMFSTNKTDSIRPKEISQSFLDSLRIAKKGDLSFGSFYHFHPDDWQSDYRPAERENFVKYKNPMNFEETDLDKLKKIFSKLTVLNDKMKCENHTSFEKECKSCSKKYEKIRYLKYSIRRFQYIYHESEIEDKITDIMISLEVLLNREAFEVKEKVTTRAATILEDDDSKKPNCKKFIQNCYDIRSEIVHGKKRKTIVKDDAICDCSHIKEDHEEGEYDECLVEDCDCKKFDDKTLSDQEVKEKLENYTKKAIIKFINLQIKHENQQEILEKIDSLFWR